MSEDVYLEKMIKHWVAKTPLPPTGRARLLWAAANLSRRKPLTLSWMDKPGVQGPADYYYGSFSWAIFNTLQITTAGLRICL